MRITAQPQFGDDPLVGRPSVNAGEASRRSGDVLSPAAARDTRGDRSGDGPQEVADGVLVTISPQARAFVAHKGDRPGATGGGAPTTTEGTQAGPHGRQGLSPQQQREVEHLQARDADVRAHEAAHVAASSGLGGTPSYEYATGPDGRRYAVGGEVSIDTSAGRTPEETLAKARTIRAAATAPADPSSQDMAVASSAARMEADAQRALQQRRQVETRAREGAGAEDVSRASAVPGGGKSDEPEDGGAPAAVPPPTAAAEVDPAMMLATLISEQIATRGGSGHSHMETGCGSCRRSVSAYA